MAAPLGTFTRRRRASLAQVDLGAALVLLALTAAVWRVGDVAARDAIATHGRNIDSGFYEQIFAGVVMLPAAGLLLLAALVNASHHRWGRPLHLAAILCGTLVGCVALAICLL